MTTLDPTDVSALAKLLCVRDQDGHVGMRIGLLATLFVTEPWTRAVREASGIAGSRRSAAWTTSRSAWARTSSSPPTTGAR